MGDFGQDYWTERLEEDSDARWLLTHSAWSNPKFTLLEDKQGRGFLLVTPFRDEEPDVMYVYYAYTLPAHRNQGVMTSLIADAARRWRSMVLEIDGPEELVWFWEARGFRFSASFSESRGWDRPLWCFQGILPRYEHFSLHRPLYYIVDGTSAYPVNRYHDRPGCHPWDYTHPLNRRRLVYGALYEETFQETLQRVVAKHPAIASIYPSREHLEDLQGKTGNKSFWRPYPDSYYPTGEVVYLYLGGGIGNTLPDDHQAPWMGDEEERLYEERNGAVASKYAVVSW